MATNNISARANFQIAKVRLPTNVKNVSVGFPDQPGALTVISGVYTTISGGMLTPDGLTDEGVKNPKIAYVARAFSAIVATDGSGDYTDIQSAIDYTNGRGGGVVTIKSGTYTLTDNITLYSNISLIGEDADDVVIDCNGGDYGIVATGDTTEYATGTVDFNNASATVSGVGTSWLANVTTTDQIVLDGNAYDIASVDRDDLITLSHNYVGGDAFTNYSYVTATFLKNIVLKDFTIKDATGNTRVGMIDFSYIRDSWIENVISQGFSSGTYGRGFNLKRCINVTLRDCFSRSNNGTGISLNSGQSCVIDNAHVLDNGVYGIELTNTLGLGTKNIIRNSTIAQNADVGIDIVSGKNIIIGNLIYRNNTRGIDIERNENLITGNIIEQNDGSGIWLYGNYCDNNTVVGNYISFNTVYGIRIDGGDGDENVIVGNNVRGYQTNMEVVYNAGTGVDNFLANNWGADVTNETRFIKMKNGSGITLTTGDIVTYDISIYGKSVETTTTQGDNKVFGIAIGTIENGDIGMIQTLGKTVSLKVNGTTDIAVGDFIGTYTEAGIGMKAGVGDTAIAIALEAYTTDDSSGVIDALLINPRIVAIA